MILVHDKAHKGPGTIRSMTAQMRIDIYSDTVCPWCFLGKRRFELALGERPQYEPRVTWRPFELNPDMPWDGVERAAYLAAKVGDPVRVAAMEEALVRHGEALGVQFRFDLIERVPNSRRSHLLIAHAARQGLQARVKDRVMRAYFQEGVDIGDPEELVRLGVEGGLSEREARCALVLREGQDGIVAAERHAAAIGVSVVPTYIFDGQYTLSGAQEPSNLARVLDQVAELAAAREAAP
jgi:predicted DsbA family dithiol-disulfide isomerase